MPDLQKGPLLQQQGSPLIHQVKDKKHKPPPQQKLVSAKS